MLDKILRINKWNEFDIAKSQLLPFIGMSPSSSTTNPKNVLSGVPFLSTVADLLRKTVVFRDLPKNIIQKHNVHLYLYNS